MLEGVTKSVSEINNIWFEKAGLFAASLVTFIVATACVAATDWRWWADVFILVVPVSIVFAAWYYSRRIPKTRKGRVGIVVSVSCRDETDKKMLNEDFVDELKRLTRSGPLAETFDFIELREHIARQILNDEDAEKIRRKTRGHLIFYGRIRTRTLQGAPTRILKMEGIVSHRSIPKNISRTLATEFAELLPRRVNINKEADFLGFQFTSEWADVVCRYIIGLAAFISGDDKYSEKLFKDTALRLNDKKSDFAIYAQIRERLPLRLSEIAIFRCETSINKWNENHDSGEIGILCDNVSKIHLEHQNDPKIIMITAISQFLSQRSTQTAKKTLLKTKKRSRLGAWHCSMAFLEGFDGQLNKALNHYRSAVMPGLYVAEINQIETFIHHTVETQPTRKGLWFCLAIFNREIKGDNSLACEYFGRFLSETKQGDYGKERKLAQAWFKQLSNSAVE